jgi:predicted phosphodiesterase
MKGVESAELPAIWRPVIGWVAGQMPASDEEVLDSWPPTLRISSAAIGSILFCHATPQNDVDIFTKETPSEELIEMFDQTNAALVVCGHTHMQFDRKIGSTRVVNAGSVGMPFGKRGAYWLLIDSSVELRRTDYDFEEAATLVKSTGYPDRDNFAERNILNPPSEDEMLKAFAKVNR